MRKDNLRREFDKQDQETTLAWLERVAEEMATYADGTFDLDAYESFLAGAKFVLERQQGEAL